MNIMDGMDAARFKSGNPDNPDKQRKAKKNEKAIKDLVQRDFNNR
ncbi:hypothetical protein [Xylanibacillus composti]|uniref:Uncharacterized protein n=1 Tax=Xylanibacillus composti TaxID=1572762 RepID=A0A8J4M2V0_9BACL|nr:hypothetical protein [Xylanibacillus composti]GIQ70245.1 hypothetical protein XYCOK13_30690 [Xylanibacillus composti]